MKNYRFSQHAISHSFICVGILILLVSFFVEKLNWLHISIAILSGIGLGLLTAYIAPVKNIKKIPSAIIMTSLVVLGLVLHFGQQRKKETQRRYLASEIANIEIATQIREYYSIGDGFDNETHVRKDYFTDVSFSEIIEEYSKNLEKSGWQKIAAGNTFVFWKKNLQLFKVIQNPESKISFSVIVTFP